MSVLIGCLSYEMHFKESRGERGSLNACVWEMNACSSDEPQYLHTEQLAV